MKIQLEGANPALLRATLIVPSALFFIFTFFNLLAVPTPEQVQSHITIAVVNSDAGLATGQGTQMLGARILEGLKSRLPVAVREVSEMDAAKALLDEGLVSAIVHLDENFSKELVSGQTVPIELVTARHLSLAETQIGQNLASGISTGFGTAIAMIRGQLAAAKLAVLVQQHDLYQSPGAITEAAPRVLVFPIWLVALIAALLPYLAFRAPEFRGQSLASGLRSSILGLVSLGLAGFFGALGFGIVAGFPSGWFILWFWLWLGSLAISWCISGIIRLLGLVSLVVVIPLIFLQQMVAGVAVPVAAAPSWISWISPFIPAEALVRGLTHFLLGGPAQAPWGTLFGFLGIGLALIVLSVAVRSLVHRKT